MDTTQIVALTGAITTLIGTLAAALVLIIKALNGQTDTIVEQINTSHAKMDALHIEVNDRLTQLLESTRLAAFHTGYAEGLVQPAPALTADKLMAPVSAAQPPPVPTDDTKA